MFPRADLIRRRVETDAEKAADTDATAGPEAVDPL
jgi:hypothetical protein